MIPKLILPLATCAYLLGQSPTEAHSFRCLVKNTGGEMMMAMADYNPYLQPYGRGTLYVASTDGSSSATTTSPELGTIAHPTVLGPESWSFETNPDSPKFTIRIHGGDMLVRLSRLQSSTIEGYAVSGDHIAYMPFGNYGAPKNTRSWTKCIFSEERLDPRDWNMPAGFGGVEGWPGN